MKSTLLLACISICLISCGNANRQEAKDSLEVPVNTEAESDPLAPPPPPPTGPVSNWEYLEKEDKMTSKTNYFATVMANEPLQFKPPYDGATTVGLTLRKVGNEQDVLLQISQGQFLSNLGENRHIKVRFDDKEAMQFGYSDPSDYSSEAIFISNTSKFIANVKKSKRVIIQCEFYDEGLQTMEFDVEGLKWDH